MDISISKIKTMIARESVRCKLVIDNKPIEQVMQFRDIDMLSAHDPVKDLRNQINKSAIIIRMSKGNCMGYPLYAKRE